MGCSGIPARNREQCAVAWLVRRTDSQRDARGEAVEARVEEGSDDVVVVGMADKHLFDQAFRSGKLLAYLASDGILFNARAGYPLHRGKECVASGVERVAGRRDAHRSWGCQHHRPRQRRQDRCPHCPYSQVHGQRPHQEPCFLAFGCHKQLFHDALFRFCSPMALCVRYLEQRAINSGHEERRMGDKGPQIRFRLKSDITDVSGGFVQLFECCRSKAGGLLDRFRYQGRTQAQFDRQIGRRQRIGHEIECRKEGWRVIARYHAQTVGQRVDNGYARAGLREGCQGVREEGIRCGCVWGARGVIEGKYEGVYREGFVGVYFGRVRLEKRVCRYRGSGRLAELGLLAKKINVDDFEFMIRTLFQERIETRLCLFALL